MLVDTVVGPRQEYVTVVMKQEFVARAEAQVGCNTLCIKTTKKEEVQSMPIMMMGKVKLVLDEDGERLCLELPKIYVENYIQFTHLWRLSCTVTGFYNEDGRHICQGIKEKVILRLDETGGSYRKSVIMCFFDSEDSGNDLAKKYGIGKDYYVEVCIIRLRKELYKNRFFGGPKFIGYAYEDIFPGRVVEVVDPSFQPKHEDKK